VETLKQFDEIQEGEAIRLSLLIGGGIMVLENLSRIALQGLKYLLIEKYGLVLQWRQFHRPVLGLIHGGLRYIGKRRVWFSAWIFGWSENTTAKKNCTNLVKPLRTIVPIRQSFSGVLKAAFYVSFGRTQPTSERGSLIVFKIGPHAFMGRITRKRTRVFSETPVYGKQQTH